MLTEASFQLRSIRLCESDGPTACTAAAVATGPIKTSDIESKGSDALPLAGPLSALHATQVVLEVGRPSNSGSATTTTPPLRYRCPAYIAQRGSSTLRDLLEDALEGGAADNATLVGTANHDASHAESNSPPPADDSIVCPLPFVDQAVFEVVALYMEHFYGVSVHDATAQGDAVRGNEHRLSTSTADSLDSSHRAGRTVAPSALRRPLRFDDLYHLSPWEHHFVLYRVLGLPWQQLTTQELVADSRWVDLLSGAVRKGLYATDGASSRTPSQAPASEASIVEAFSLTARQRMWGRLSAVLEAATRLGVEGLQLLCAAVAANMLVDVDEGGLGQLMGGSVPPFTSEARANLLHKFPWLSREAEKVTSAAVK